MPLPPTRTVTGTYTNPVTGQASTGTVTFTPIPGVWTDTDGDQLLTGGDTVTLVNGAFSQALVTTDADDVQPATGRYWRIEERVSGHMHRVRVFALPVGAGTPIDITAIVAADPGATQYTPVEGPTGPQGPPGSEAEAEAYTDAAITTHAAAVDPHGDRAWADGKFATILVVNTLTGDVTTLDGFVQDCLTRVAAIEGGTAFLAGLQVDGDAQVSNGNLTITDFTRGYRLRLGSANDFEATGGDLIISNWSGTAFNGTQRSYDRYSADALNVQHAGKREFVAALYGAVVHTIDPDNDTLGFHGAAPVAQQTVAGSWADGSAGASLAAALATLGLIVDDTTP